MNYSKIKRLLDFVVASIVLLLLSPILLGVLVLLVVFGHGEILFLQERVGRFRRTFKMVKFSTMMKESIDVGTKTVTLRNDPRVSTLGRFLRYSKLNELPQLINIWKGDMSFIGPRPLLPTSFLKYEPYVQERISKCYPGLSGIGSILFRDEEHIITAISDLGINPLSYYKKFIYPYKGRVEVWYADHISFSTDIKLILLTLYSLASPSNDLIFRVFPDLPKKPVTLTKQGINPSMCEEV